MKAKRESSGPKSFRILWSLLCGIFFVAMSGCYMSGGISNLSGTIPMPSVSPKPLATVGNEFVSGSAQYENTLLRNYKIISSAGSYNRELVTKTPRGYRIYSSVQGSMISEDGKK